MANLNELMKRREKAVGAVQEWRSLLDKVYRYAAPNKNAWQDSGSQGQPPQSKAQNLTSIIYDLTLLIGTRNFVNRLVNALIPQTEQWLRFIPGSDIEEEFKSEAARLLQDLTDRFFRFINDSNFYLAVPEAFEDCAISTGCVQINEGDDDEPLVFASVPSNSIAYELGIDGSFKGYFRDFVGIKIEEIESSWPQANISNDMRSFDQACRIGNGKQLHVVEATLYDYKTKMWNTTVYEMNTKHVMIEDMIEEQPAFAAFRWNRRSGEILGRGPAMDAMPAAASINEAMKDELIAAAFRANPMYMAYTDSVVNPDMFNITPGAILAVLPTSAGTWPLAPVPMAGDVNFGILVVQDLREQINKLMFASPLGPVDSPNQTATEVTIRMKELVENAAASFSRLKREFFDMLVKRIIYILKKRGEWPNIEINGKNIAVKFETPLSATHGQREVEKVSLFHQIMANIVGPELTMASMNLPKLPFFIAENLEVDLKLVNDEREILDKINEAQNQTNEQIQQAGAQGAGAVLPPQQEELAA